MKNKLLALTTCLLCLLLCAGAVSVSARSSPNPAQEIYDGIIDSEAGGKEVQEWIDSELCATAGTGAEWYILCLAQSGEAYDFSTYEAALLEYLSQNNVPSATTRQKYALVLAAIGSTDAYIATVAEQEPGSQGVMSYVYGLHLLHAGYSGQVTVEEAVAQLLSLQKEDGGWAIGNGGSDVDVTAMALQALAPHRDRTEVSEAVDRALRLLSARQTEDGGYVSYGVPNPESAAQVIIALCALEIDPLTDPRFIKNGNTAAHAIEAFALGDGSYCHTGGGAYSEAATAQVLCAATAYLRYLQSDPPFYDPDHARPDLVQSPDRGEGEQTAAPQAQSPTERDSLAYKPYACAAALLLGGVACLALYLGKKRHYKNFIAAGLATCLVLAGVILIDVRLPRDYYGEQSESKHAPIGTVTLIVRCDRVPDLAELDHLPDDGILLAAGIYEIEQGDTAYDVLIEAARRHGLHVDAAGLGQSAYIRGIAQLYEQQYGELSGWTYQVNGSSPAMGCGAYTLSDGDEILFEYSLTLTDPTQN